MLRRTLLAAAACALAMPAAAAEDYVPGLVDQHLAAGRTVFLDYTATWCGTCRSQGRTLAKLKAENPAYEQGVTFIDIDWDTYRGSEIVSRYGVPRRSTLIALSPSGEIGRIVAGTREADIKALMDAALAASAS